MAEREIGHFLLKRLGKTKLRPGGAKATNWLIDKIDFTKSPVILEVACNEAYNLMDFAEKYKNKNIGIDINKKAIESAKRNIAERNLQDYVKVRVGNALSLPFDDNSFDVIINEAMLTMFDNENKKKALSEYYRVLKKGGILLTQDVMLINEDEKLIKEMQYVINNPVRPLTKENWLSLHKEIGFSKSSYFNDKMTLLSNSGLMHDEGLFGMLKILKNGIFDKNRKQFFEMSNFFRKNRKKLNFIAICSEK